MNILPTVFQKYFLSYKGLPKSCWQDIFFILLNAISVGICFFLSLYFVDTLYFDMVKVGFLMSSYGLGTVLGGMISGELCDRFPSRWMAIFSLLLQSSAFLSLAFFHFFGSLILVLFLLGTSNYSFKTANVISMLSHCNNEKPTRLKALNISHAASNFGLGTSGVIVGLVASYGYPILFYMASLLLLSLAIYLFLVTRINIICENKNNTIISEQSDKTASPNLHTVNNIKLLTLVLLSVFFVGMIIAQLGSTYPVYVKNAFPELATKGVSILFILDTVLIVLFQAPLSNYYGRFNTILVMGIGAFLMGLGMLILSASAFFFIAMISCCIWTIGEMLFMPTAQLLCYEQGNKTKKGQSMGIFQATYAISTVIGPTLGGFMYSKVGVNSMWYLSFLIGAVCLILCMLTIRTKEHPQFLLNRKISE